MDNLPAHKVAGIRAFAFEAVGATVVYLSKEVRRGKLPPATLRPYSPDFSPIENCWSKVKEFLRARAARTYAELEDVWKVAMSTSIEKSFLGFRLNHIKV